MTSRRGASVLSLLAVLACSKTAPGPTPAGHASAPDSPPSSGSDRSQPAAPEGHAAHPDLAALETALVIENGTYEVAPNLMVPTAWVRCRTGEDCVALEGGCCDHCNGGFLASVNRDHAPKLQPYLDRFGCEGSPTCTEKACDAPRDHELDCMTNVCFDRELEIEVEAIWKEHLEIPGEVPGGVRGGHHGDPVIVLPSDESPPVVSVDEPIATVKANAVYLPDCDRARLARTPAARSGGKRGKTSVRFCVSNSGKPTTVETTREYGPDPKVDEVCRNTVKKWRFKPFFDQYGDPIEVCSEVTFDVRFD